MMTMIFRRRISLKKKRGIFWEITRNCSTNIGLCILLKNIAMITIQPSSGRNFKICSIRKSSFPRKSKRTNYETCKKNARRWYQKSTCWNKDNSTSEVWSSTYSKFLTSARLKDRQKTSSRFSASYLSTLSARGRLYLQQKAGSCLASLDIYWFYLLSEFYSKKLLIFWLAWRGTRFRLVLSSNQGKLHICSFHPPATNKLSEHSKRNIGSMRLRHSKLKIWFRPNLSKLLSRNQWEYSFLLLLKRGKKRRWRKVLAFIEIITTSIVKLTLNSTRLESSRRAKTSNKKKTVNSLFPVIQMMSKCPWLL